MIVNRIPAGLINRGTEFFTVFEGMVQRVMCFYNGRPYAFRSIPDCRKEIARKELAANPLKEAAIERMVGKNPSRKLEKFIACNYGACNDTPDISEDGVLTLPEYVPCPYRGTCKEEGKGCSSITVNGVTLSMSQTRVFNLVTLDNQAIADKLFISVETVKTHMRDIQEKTGLNGKGDMIHWATIKGII